MSDKTFKIVDGDLSDGYHTFDDLYRHRHLLFIAFLISNRGKVPSYFVRDHFVGWDLVVAELPEQISYHIPFEYRTFYLGVIPEKEAAEHIWDEHTSNDVLQRLGNYILGGAKPASLIGG